MPYTFVNTPRELARMCRFTSDNASIITILKSYQAKLLLLRSLQNILNVHKIVRFP